MNPNTVFETSLQNAASTLATSEVAIWFRDAQSGSIIVDIMLTNEQNQYVQDCCNFPLMMKGVKTTTTDHPVLVALRTIVKNGLQKIYNVADTNLKTLCVGASAVEYSQFNSNPNVFYWFTNSENKDVARILVPCVQKLIAGLKLKEKKRQKNELRQLRVSTLEDIRNRLNTLNPDLPDNVVLEPCSASVLYFQDSFYNYGPEDYDELFEKTGACIAYGYGFCPLNFLFADFPDDPYYNFKAFCEKGTMYAKVTYKGFMNGYCHRIDKWATIFNNPVFCVNGRTYVFEILIRCGPMIAFQLFRANHDETIPRTIQLTPNEMYVQVLDLWASVNKNTLKLEKFVYISVREAELMQVINYIWSIEIKSATVQNTILMIRRRMGGMALFTNGLVHRWALHANKVHAIALTATIYANYMSEKSQEIMESINIDSAWGKFSRALRMAVGKIFWPITDLISWILSAELQTKLITYPEHMGIHDKVYHVKKLDASMKPIMGLYTPTEFTPDGNNVPNNNNINPKSPINNAIPMQLLNDVSPKINVNCRDDCFVCSIKPKIIPQKINIINSKITEHTFSLVQSDLDELNASLLATDKLPVGLAKVMTNMKAALPKGPFSVKTEVYYISGGPGTGKSYVIRELIKKYGGMVLAPFANLNKEYRDDKSNGIEYNFKTNHRCMDCNDKENIFVDEFTSFNYNFLACAVWKNHAKRVFLVGDIRQTHLRPEEGVPIISKIDFNNINTHELIVNFRNPANIVDLLNKVFGYNMESIDPTRVVDYEVKTVSEFESDPKYRNYYRGYFTKTAKENYDDMIDQDEYGTVRAWQGSSKENFAVYLTGFDTYTSLVEPLMIVALSRHKQNLVLVKDDSPVIHNFLQTIGQKLEWKEKKPAPEIVEPQLNLGTALCGHRVQLINIRGDEFNCDETSIRMPWQTDVINNVPHQGQNKLKYIEKRFLDGLPEGSVICYIGAAPGYHIMELIEEYISFEWILVDPRDFVYELISYSEKYPQKLKIIQELATEKHSIFKFCDVLISDIRTDLKNCNEMQALRRVKADMDLQRNIVTRHTNIVAYMLKFKLMKEFEAFEYLDGDLWFQPYAKLNTTELRLVNYKRSGTSVVYDANIILDKLFYHNTFVRNAYIANLCFDCYYTHLIKIKYNFKKCVVESLDDLPIVPITEKSTDWTTDIDDDSTEWTSDSSSSTLGSTMILSDTTASLSGSTIVLTTSSISTNPKWPSTHESSLTTTSDIITESSAKTNLLTPASLPTLETVVHEYNDDTADNITVVSFTDDTFIMDTDIDSDIIIVEDNSEIMDEYMHYDTEYKMKKTDKSYWDWRSFALNEVPISNFTIGEICVEEKRTPIIETVANVNAEKDFLLTKDLNLNNSTAAVTSIDFVAELNEHVSVSPIAVYPAKEFEKPNLNFVPKIEHPPKDAYLLLPEMIPPPMADFSQPYTSINEVESQITSDTHVNASVKINPEEFITPVNQRGHPQNVKTFGYALGQSYGHTFQRGNPLQTAKTIGTRYANVAKPKKLNETNKRFARAVVDNYYHYFKDNVKIKMLTQDLDTEDPALTNFYQYLLADVRARHYYEQYVGNATNWDVKTIRFHLKEIFKPYVVMKGKFDPTKAGQGICNSDVKATVHFMFACRLIQLIDLYTEKRSNDYTATTDHTKTEVQFYNEIKELIEAMFPKGKPKVAIGDMPTFDAKQGDVSRYQSKYYLMKLNISEELLDKYYEVYSKATVISTGIEADTNVKTSGNPWTLFENGLLAKINFCYIYIADGAELLMYKGDDVGDLALNGFIDEDRRLAVLREIGFDFTITKNFYGEFCGLIVTSDGVFPNLWRKVAKLCGHKFRSYQHFVEYQTSLRDWCNNIKKVGLNEVIEATMFLRKVTSEEANAMWYAIDSISHINETQFNQVFTKIEITPLLPTDYPGDLMEY